MSFINFTSSSSETMSTPTLSGPTSCRRGSMCDSNEWIARTEVVSQGTDPFGDPPPVFEPIISQAAPHTRTVIRKLGLKRNTAPCSKLNSKVKLDRVLGLTVSNNASLDCDQNSGTVVYPAGCVLVLYNQRRNKQFHIINSLKKPITACRFSSDGKYIVTGECGHQPHVRVWEVATGEQLASLAGHKYGINCVAFSPDGKYVVSIGSQHDMLVNVWDWRADHVVASNKVSVKVKAVSFSEKGDYFVTVGNRHIKFWYLDFNNFANKNKFDSLPLMGRNAILGDQRNNYFCDVVCGRGDSKESTFAITKSGLLCEFNNRRLLNKWVELKTESSNCVTITRELICVGCAQGIIRCFRPQSLEFVCTLPRPHYLGIDIAKGAAMRSDLAPRLSSLNSKPKYADTVAVVYDQYNKIVTAIYSDRSIYFWTLNDIKRIGKLNSFLNHSSCIWDLEIYPFYQKNSRPLLPPGTFLTCSSDDTIRIWNTELETNSKSSAMYIYKKNLFSPELLKILYMDPELAFLCDQDLTQSRSSANGNGATSRDDTSYDSKNGIRAIKFSADGRHLASGDRSGNIRVFDLEQQKDLFKIEAHDAEVLCLEYSNEELCGRTLLVSASRDRFIHIYDVHRQYSCIQNIDDHSSSITSVKFVCDKLNPKVLQLISCGADKSLIFRKQTDANADFRLEHHVAGKSTFYDMAVDGKKNQIVTASQDRLIRTYDAKSGKNNVNFKGSLGDDGALIKIAFDPSATFIATSCTDKSIYIYDYQTGECLATTTGHSEIVTGLKFSQDGRNLLSISGDGCIFIWRLPVEMTNAIASKLGLPLISEQCQSTTITNRALNLPLQSANNNHDYRFNVSSLPTWAKKQMFEELTREPKLEVGEEKETYSKTLPRGRWAQRVIEEGPSDMVLNQGLVKSYANTFESLASRSTPSTPSGANSPTLKELKISSTRLNSMVTPTRERAKSSMSSGVEDDDDDRNTTDSDNTCSHDSSYKVTKVADRSKHPKHSQNCYSMVSSISMANINDLPYDEDEASETSEEKNKPDVKSRYNSLYISTENLDRIDQRNRYLKSLFENIDKSHIENSNSASDDSGINQIDHSLSSSTTSSTLVNHSGVQASARQSLSSKYHKSAALSPQKQSGVLSDGASDDATLSDITDITTDQPTAAEAPSTGLTGNLTAELSKCSVLDTIKETPFKDDNGSPDKESNPPAGVVGLQDTETSTNSSTTQSSVSKKREELAKAINDAKMRLESINLKLTNSKSVANLRDPCVDEPDKDDQSYHSLSVDAFRKSISLSDLSASQTLPKKLSVYRKAANMNNFHFDAPLWHQRRPMHTANSGSLSRTPSSTTLNKVDMMRSQSTLCRQAPWNSPNGGVANHQSPASHLKPPLNGHHGVNSPAPSNQMMINPLSGRSSAPPAQFRKQSAATISCASSRRGDSTEDDEELESAINSDDDHSEEHRALRARPVTPPKPNILKQIRRSSNTTNQITPTGPHYHNPGHYVPNHQPMNGQSTGHGPRPRRLWATDTMRSSKSEFNLANIGRDTPVRRRNNSGASGNLWSGHNPSVVVNDRLDLALTNPSSIPLSLDLCQHLVNEMNFLTGYASRIFERASYSDNVPIVDYLSETLGQVSRDIQAIIGSKKNATEKNNNLVGTTTANSQANGAPSLPADTQEIFQQFLNFLQARGGANGVAQSNGTTSHTTNGDH